MNPKAILAAGVVAGVSCAIAAPSHASLFATWSQARLQFSNLGRAEASATGSGLTLVTTSSATSQHLSTLTFTVGPVSALSLNTAIPVTDPSAAPVTSVILSSVRVRPELANRRLGNISGAIASTVRGILPNALPKTGGVTICLLAAPLPACSSQLSLSLGQTTAGVPVGVGIGGILTLGGTGTVRISVMGAPYTVKSVSAVNRTANGGFEALLASGFAHGPASLTSSTAQTSGVLQLVSATHTTAVGLGDGDLGGSISELLVHFIHDVPEPGLPLAFSAGAVLLGLLGERRRRRWKTARPRR